MRLFSVMLMLVLSSVALAGDIVRGDALRRREYQTYANLSLFVDPTGSDSNGCTASGTSACATLSGALAKVPLNINHAVTISMAAGTYADTPYISGFNFNGLTAAMSITGAAHTNAPVATGTATGTSTAFVDQSNDGSTLGLLTDSTQTWTVNDLRGRFMLMTSGAASGAYKVITGNTATTISFAGIFPTSEPVAGDTYTVVTPSTVITNGIFIRGLRGLGTLALENIATETASNIQYCTNSAITIRGSRFRTTVANSQAAMSIVGVTVIALGSASTSNVFLAEGSSTGGAMTALRSTSVTLSHGFYYSVSTSNAALTLNTVSLPSGGSQGTTYVSGARTNLPTVVFSGAPWVVGGLSGSSAHTLMVDCRSGASSIGIGSGIYTSNLIGARLDFCNTHIINCTSGFVLGNGVVANLVTPCTQTFTGATNEITLDEAAYSYSTVNGYSPKIIRTSRGTAFSINQP